MAKRSTGRFPREERDFYITPFEAVPPLIPHLDPGVTFAEPCAGNGALVRHLTQLGILCERASDVLPQVVGIVQEDVFQSTYTPRLFITNPPWDREILHPLIEWLICFAPCWLLFDADWAHTGQAHDLMWRYCVKHVAVGRVKWFADTKHSGKDNCAWYLFDRSKTPGPAQFYPKVPTEKRRKKRR